jgi:hypothetical protein
MRPLRDRFSDSLLLAVPGIIRRTGPHGEYLTIAGPPGLLIPIRSVAGLVVGLVVRPDEQGDGGKYKWLSSVPTGPSSGARVHVPARVIARDSVVVTEGALKADVAAFLAPGRSIIGLPGCRVTAEAIDALRTLKAHEALLALDADAVQNPAVALAQLHGLGMLNAAGFNGGLLTWDAKLGKGLDDMLLTWRRQRGA